MTLKQNAKQIRRWAAIEGEQAKESFLALQRDLSAATRNIDGDDRAWATACAEDAELLKRTLKFVSISKKQE